MEQQFHLMQLLISFFVGVIASIVAGLIVVGISKRRKKNNVCKSSLSGQWEQFVYDKNQYPNNHKAIDIVKCWHDESNNTLFGEIKREWASDANIEKKWKFYGKKIDGSIVLAYWTVTDKNPGSAGSIIMNYSEKEGLCLGVYHKISTLRMSITKHEKEIIKTELSWKKII